MKGTDNFKKVIEDQMEQMALSDTKFAEKYNREGKNIDDCIKYILNTVQKSGVQGFTDDEVFGMAIHYYDEDDINVGGDVNCHVVVNHTVQLTEEEIKEEREKARRTIMNEERVRLTRKTVKKEPEKKVEQASLF